MLFIQGFHFFAQVLQCILFSGFAESSYNKCIGMSNTRRVHHVWSLKVAYYYVKILAGCYYIELCKTYYVFLLFLLVYYRL